MRGSSTGNSSARSSAYISSTSVANAVAWAYASRSACVDMTRAMSRSPCPRFTTTAPPAASRYRFPSASVIHTPSARTAIGVVPDVRRGNTWLIADSVSQPHLQLYLVVHRDAERARLRDARLQLAGSIDRADPELAQPEPTPLVEAERIEVGVRRVQADSPKSLLFRVLGNRVEERSP